MNIFMSGLREQQYRPMYTSNPISHSSEHIIFADSSSCINQRNADNNNFSRRISNDCLEIELVPEVIWRETCQHKQITPQSFIHM